MLRLLLILMLSAPYAIPGASVRSSIDCSSSGAVLAHTLTATTAGHGRYVAPGLAGYPTVSILTSANTSATVDGDAITWGPHGAGDTLVIVGGRVQPCPAAFDPMRYAGRWYAPLVVK